MLDLTVKPPMCEVPGLCGGDTLQTERGGRRAYVEVPFVSGQGPLGKKKQSELRRAMKDGTFSILAAVPFWWPVQPGVASFLLL